MMKPKFRSVLELAVEQGVRYGYTRAHKHNENPSGAVIIEFITEQVMNSMDDWFNFTEEN